MIRDRGFLEHIKVMNYKLLNVLRFCSSKSSIVTKTLLVPPDETNFATLMAFEIEISRCRFPDNSTIDMFIKYVNGINCNRFQF